MKNAVKPLTYPILLKYCLNNFTSHYSARFDTLKAKQLKRLLIENNRLYYKYSVALCLITTMILSSCGPIFVTDHITELKKKERSWAEGEPSLSYSYISEDYIVTADINLEYTNYGIWFACLIFPISQGTSIDDSNKNDVRITFKVFSKINDKHLTKDTFFMNEKSAEVIIDRFKDNTKGTDINVSSQALPIKNFYSWDYRDYNVQSGDRPEIREYTYTYNIQDINTISGIVVKSSFKVVEPQSTAEQNITPPPLILKFTTRHGHGIATFGHANISY